MFAPKFRILPLTLQEEIWNAFDRYGARNTAAEYQEKSGMTYSSLFQYLNKHKNNRQLTEEYVPYIPGTRNPKTQFKRSERARKKVRLTGDEESFIRRLETGEATMEEGQSMLAAKVFRKIFENPDDVKFIDLFRTELIKLKKDESKAKMLWGNELLMRMFAGKLPPSVCPKCGHNFMDTKVIEAEVIENESTIPTQL